ncbi:hypothetical protein JCM11641_000565 [Rhodosporidiobolus odoratus]
MLPSQPTVQPPSSPTFQLSPDNLDNFLNSPSPTPRDTEPSFAREQDHPIALTTAHERPTSPVGSLLSASSEANEPGGGGTSALGGSGLSRRSSSRVRRASEVDAQRAATGSSEERRGDTQLGQVEAVPLSGNSRERTTSEHGWRQWRSPEPSSPAAAPRQPVRQGTIEMGDGSIVRRLPRTPADLSQPPRSNALASSAASSSTFSHSTSAYDDPFRSSNSAATPPALFNPVYSVSSSSSTPAPAPLPLSRVESHPLSLALSHLTSRTSLSSEDEGDLEPTLGPSHRLPSEDEDDFEARSPLQPTPFQSTPNISSLSSGAANRRRAVLPVRSSRRSPYLGTPGVSPSGRLSLSPSRRLSPHLSPGGGAHGEGSGNISSASLGSGWRELSPSRGGGGEDGTPRHPGLTRKTTLSAVTGGLRRMSVRVVNVTGVDHEADVDEAAQAQQRSFLEGEKEGGLGRSPSIRALGAGDRSRSSVKLTLAERRASRITVTTAEGDRSRISEEEEEAIGGGDGEDEKGETDEEGVLEQKWEKTRTTQERAYRVLRGNTLGVFGPDNKLRKGCARVLTAPWTEPIILLLIILQVVILTIQSSFDVYAHPRPSTGYFHTWEDYCLFAIFICFTVEIAARILVTGLVVNPPLPPAPIPPKLDLYGGGTPGRSPSLIGKMKSRLSPHPSPHNSPLPSPTRTHRSPLPSPTRLSPLPPGPYPQPPPSPTSGCSLSPVPLSPVKDPGTYPPPSSTDIATLPYSHPYDNDEDRGLSAVSLVRDNSHAAPPPSTPLNLARKRIGLGLSAPSGGGKGRIDSSAPEPSFSIRAALASTLPTAAGAASSSAAAASASESYYSHTPYALSIRRQRETYQRAFLRHSWNRIDAVAVLAFWISFALSCSGVEYSENLWFFRALSVIRATRLLAVTAGTQTILQSLKKASPLLVDVGLFVAFAMILFAIIGVQAFRGSYKRSCQWIDPDGIFDNVTSSDQHCGGHVDAITGNQTGYLLSSYEPSGEDPKGFICGSPSVCVIIGNPVNGAWSFDNIFASMMQVFVIASANTWTDGMYAMMDSDYYVSCLFFIFCLLIVNYWMFSLFVACITTTFGDIRDETKHSAFGTTSVVPAKTKYDDDRKPHRAFTRSTSLVRKVYEKTSWLWVAAALASVAIQAASEYGMDPHLHRIYGRAELGLTLGFDFEIIVRLFASLPDWRSFFASSPNVVDMTLAVVTSTLQIPVIKDSPAYAWLTCFQIARFYRVILFIPRMRKLLARVLGTFTSLINMIFFLLLMNFVAALISVQLLRSLPDQESDDTGVFDFHQIYNAFLGMYQILSSENWTTVLQTALASEKGLFQIVLTAVFLCGWMFFSFFILGNLFIAVLNENFAIAEEEKRARQAEAFVNRTAPAETSGWFRRFDPYAISTRSKSKATTNVTSATMVAEPEEIDRNMTASPEPMEEVEDEKDPPMSATTTSTRFFHQAAKSMRFQSISENVQRYVDPQTPEVDRSRYIHPRDGTTRSREATIQEQERVQEVAQERRDQIAKFIAQHPMYDKTLWLFPSSSRIRQFCQSLVEPSYGNERITGRPPSPKRQRVFSALILVAIVASIAIAGVATPLYRRNYYIEQGSRRWTWYNLVEASLGATFLTEALVKWVADGFLWAPNAYLLSLWNDIDFFILLTLVINVTTSLLGGTGSGSFTRALKAFRALRLINLSASMRTTFYNVLIVGAGRIMDASILAALYIVPFAVYGGNIFRGLLYSCSDSNVTNKAQCAGEFMVETVEGWSYLAPRVWSNPQTWSFDTFRSSLLILFEIISLEGWIDVEESVMQIVGQDQQPQENAQQWNALFFVAYNLLGATFILTLFVSLIILNFTERTSASLLTTEQRQWLDLRRFIFRQRPAKRPKHRPSSGFRAWCFDRAISKHGWWSRSVTVLYVLNILVLMTQAETTSAADDARNYIFLGFTLLYTLDVVVRICGLGYSFFRGGWNLFDLTIISGTVATTVLVLAGSNDQVAIQLQKLFLCAVAFKLVQRNDSLNQLFKTAAASLPAILNIMALWLVLFLVFAIFYLELFGLTRWGASSTHFSNYYTFWNAMVLLALQSTGEGWNAYMHEYTIEFPKCTNSNNYLYNDCGSTPAAYALFILWNVLSMYLFVNLVLGAVIENFSFVFQAYGKVTNINREQMRHFKKTWAQFDTERTGHLQPNDIGRFLHRLSSIFEVKIYRDEWSAHNLQAAARRDVTEQHNSPAFYHYLAERDAFSLQRLDLGKLRQLIDGIDVGEVRQRREIFLHVYHEAKLEAEASFKGISFTKMLMLIAQYRLVNDDMALQMEELAERRQKQHAIAEKVQMDRLHSFLLMIVLRRRYLARQQANRREEMGAPIPAINIVEEGSPVSTATPQFATSSPSSPPSHEAVTSEGDGDESILETPSRGRAGGTPSGSSAAGPPGRG